MTNPRAKSTILLASLAVLAVLGILWPNLRSRSDDPQSLTRAPDPSMVEVNTTEKPLPAPTQGEIATRSTEEAIPGNEEVVQQPPTVPTEEEPEPGFIYGNIRDSSGVIVSQGRILLFADRRLSRKISVLELEGPNREYRCELPADKSYYLLVDPASLGSGYIPALSKSRTPSGFRSPDRPKPSNLEAYTKYYVFLRGGEEVRTDLEVGVPASVTGRLLDSNGLPLEGAMARMSGLSEGIAGLSESTMTDSDGIFSLAEIFPGDHRLNFYMAGDWSPPQTLDVKIAGGERRDLGDFHAGGDGLSIRGRIVNQDGDPFPGLGILCYSNLPAGEGLPAHNMGSHLDRTSTDAEGFFELTDLPAIPVKVSLTPDYHPGKIGGVGQLAYWEHPVLVDLMESASTVDIGTHTLDESRPFELLGRVTFDVEWLAEHSRSKKGLRCTISPVEGQSLPEGVRRSSIDDKPVDIDLESDTYSCIVETPRPEIELRFHLKGFEELIFTVQPTAHGSWPQDIHVPLDFTPKKP